MDGWGNGSEKEFQKKKKPRVGGVEVETQTQYDYSTIAELSRVYRYTGAMCSSIRKDDGPGEMYRNVDDVFCSVLYLRRGVHFFFGRSSVTLFSFLLSLISLNLTISYSLISSLCT